MESEECKAAYEVMEGLKKAVEMWRKGEVSDRAFMEWLRENLKKVVEAFIVLVSEEHRWIVLEVLDKVVG